MVRTSLPPRSESFARWTSYGTGWPAGSPPASTAPTPQHSWPRLVYLRSISPSTAYRSHIPHALRVLSRPKTPLPLGYPLTSLRHGHFKLPSEKTFLLESKASTGPSPGAPLAATANPEYDFRWTRLLTASYHSSIP